MDKSDKLIFFNKEGYPYNFQYDDENKKWWGTLIFDENSNTLFKTIGLYIFEKVDPIDVTLISDFEPSQLFNYSGMTFISKTYEYQQVTNIEKVNSDEMFYTKWIYGEDFDIKFRPGTIITFNDESGNHTGSQWNEFINNTLTYFPVLSTKKNAILISTLTNNKLYNNIIFESGITISSHNIIKIPDYGDETLVNINNLNYYNGKKMSIVNSYYNDGIKTFNDYSILKNKIYDFNLSNETTGYLNLDITLYTERPILYTGPLTINITDTSTYGSEIIFHNDINNDINFFDTGQTIIFENYVGDSIFGGYNPIFTITGYKDKNLILSTGITFVEEDDRYFLYIDGITSLTGLSFVDQIYLESVSFESGITIHHSRTFDVMYVFNPDDNNNKVRIEVEQYVSSEYGNIYNIYKKYKKSQIQTLYAQQGSYTSTTYSGGTNCFSTTNHIRISQEILDKGDREYYYENTIDAINLIYGNFLNFHGIDILHHYYSGISYMLIEGIQEYNYNQYFSAISNINGTSLNVGNNFTFTTGFTNSDVYYFETKEQLNSEKVKINELNKLNRNFRSEIKLSLNNDLIDYGFKITLNSVEYFIKFTGNTEQTIDSFIEKYSDVFNRLGFSLNKVSNYPDISDILPSYGSSVGDINYDINYDLDNDGDVDLLDATSLSYNRNEYTTLVITGNYPNVEVYDFDVFVNIYSSYEMVEISQNNGIIIASDILKSVDVNLFDLGLSTGMVVSLNDSVNSLNNKEYNILDITEHEILLSYQGPFISDYCEDGRTLEMHVKEFIRKPRSYYNKKVDYKFSWVEPEYGTIDTDIFFYDYTGNQLKPYNDISGLTYTGIKPLYNDTSETKVFLNKEPNKFESEINNPSAQQTIFDNIKYELETLNDSNAYNYLPEPLELFLGFYSEKEGVSVNEFKLEKIEYGYYTGVTQEITDIIEQKQFIISGDTITYLTNNPLFDFSNYNFEEYQIISIDFKDTSETGQTIYDNYGSYRIIDITPTKIKIDIDYSGNLGYFNTKDLYDNSGKTFNFVIKTEPRELLRCKVYGQSEIEDERLDINLRNLGINIFKEAEFIFQESDIDEHSVDYIRLNRKRKEMLTIYNQIFDYVGSYKSLIHSIDFFGYNDLKLYEYYRNIKPDSPLYGKLFKILIPDIFDNSVNGWTDDNFIKDNYDKGYYKKTNLFNLTYRITDEFGNYSLQYSLDDVQTKLMSLVKWLRKNIIPLSSNIRDITGVSDCFHELELRHDTSTWVTKSVIDDVVVGVNFYYTSTRINKNNFLFTINFYILDGYEKPESYTVKIKTFSIDSETFELIPQSNKKLYKVDYDPYSMNINMEIDQYILVEVDTFNGYGVGYSNSKMFKYDIGKNFILVNSNFNTDSFLYVNTEDGFYIIKDGRYYIIKQ